MSCAFSAGQGCHRRDDVVQSEFYVLDIELAGFDLGKVQDVVDDREQRASRIVDFSDVIPLFIRQIRFQREMRQPIDGVHGRAHLVAHVREEHRLELGGFLRLLFGEFQRVFLIFALADVEDRDRDLGVSTVAGWQRAQSDFDGKPAPILMQPAQVSAGDHFSGRRSAVKCGLERRTPGLVPGRDERSQRLTDQFLPGTTEQVFTLGVRQFHYPGVVDHHQPVGREFQHAAEELLGLTHALFALLDLLLRALVFGDVLIDPVHVLRFAVLSSDDPAGSMQPDDLAVRRTLVGIDGVVVLEPAHDRALVKLVCLLCELRIRVDQAGKPFILKMVAAVRLDFFS